MATLREPASVALVDGRHPGKKFLSMGDEFGAGHEFDAEAAFPWPADDGCFRRGAMRLVQDLDRLYRPNRSRRTGAITG